MRPQRTAQMRPLSGERLFTRRDFTALWKKFPVKAPKKPRVVEERTVLVIQDGSCTAIRKRPPKGLLAGLYELPNTEGYLNREGSPGIRERAWRRALIYRRTAGGQAYFSHIEWRMKAYRIRVSSWSRHMPREFFLQIKRIREKLRHTFCVWRL